MVHEGIEELGGETRDFIRTSLDVAPNSINQTSVHDDRVGNRVVSRVQLPPVSRGHVENDATVTLKRRTLTVDR